MMKNNIENQELNSNISDSDVKNEQNEADVIDQPKKPALPPHKEYANRMQKYKNKYITILVISCALIAAAICVAILLDLMIGVAIAVFAAIFYVRFASNEMYSTIGIDYKTYSEGLKITICRARYGDVLWIPSKLIFFEVTRIEDKAFANKHNEELRCVFLPKSLKSIGKDVFEECPALEDIFFEGSESEWENIEKETDFSELRITFDAKYPPLKKKGKKKSSKKTSV